MSHSKIRKNKRCQNCGHFVAGRFCPECGQENVETRRRFHYLFVHFMQDLVHYDSKLWKTIKFLLLPTAKLTKDYLAGKRKSQVNPVQLYMFISFIVFFIPHIIPGSGSNEHSEKQKYNDYTSYDFRNEKIGDNGMNLSLFGFPKINTIEELDSIQQTLPTEQKLSIIKYTIYKKILGLREMENPREKLIEAFVHNFPKAIFLYMPIFAFWLWLFHSKKKWLYFDHGIYTLHYFSFILLSILLYIIGNWLCSLFHGKIYELITVAMFLYFIYYFFHSHRRMYQERKAVSRLICTVLFFINTIGIIIFLVLYVLVIAWISSAV